MKLNGSMNFCFKYIDELHGNRNFLFHIPYDNVKLYRNFELEKLFQLIEITITKDFILTLPITIYPSFITVDFFSIAIGCVLFQMSDKENWIVLHRVFGFSPLMIP